MLLRASRAAPFSVVSRIPAPASFFCGEVMQDRALPFLAARFGPALRVLSRSFARIAVRHCHLQITNLRSIIWTNHYHPDQNEAREFKDSTLCRRLRE